MKTIINLTLMIFATTNVFSQASSCGDNFTQSSDTSQVGQTVTFTCLHTAADCGPNCAGGEVWWEWHFCNNSFDCTPNNSNAHGPISVTYNNVGTYYPSMVSGFYHGSNCSLICYCTDYASYVHTVTPTNTSSIFELTLHNSDSFKILGLFPNPTKSDIYYSVFSSNKDKVAIKLIDVLGRKLIDEQGDLQLGENKLSLNLSSCTQGIYTIQLISQSGHQTQKQFIIK